MQILDYEPKDKTAIDISRDLLRTLDRYSSDDNCKRLCLLVEVAFEE